MEKLVADLALFPSEDDCQRRGINYQPYREKQSSPVDKLTLSEIIWDLIQERVLTPGEHQADQGFPFFRLTEFGKGYISQAGPHFYDPEGYMESLRNIVQNLDPVIE